MDIFDIIGPVMVGPSSSHTAGAVRIGYIAGKLMGEPIAKAEILLYGSFLATGKGHGTRKALVAGDAHPNTAQIFLTSVTDKKLEVVGESLGGSRINIAQIDGISTNFSGDYPTLVVHNMDQPGHVAEVTSMLAHKSVNIAAMQLYRAGRGGNSVMVLECDQEVPEEGINWLRHAEGVVKVTYLGLE